MSAQIPASNPQFWKNFDTDPWHVYLGIRLLSHRENYGKLELNHTATTPQGIGGSVHGGALASLVDIAALAAIHGNIEEGAKPAGTADLNISYLRQTHGPRIVCEAQVIKRGRQLAVVEARIFDDKERLCCLGKVTYAFRAT